MKKFLIVVLVLAAAVTAAFFVVKKAMLHRPQAAELVPADTILFAQIPDMLTSVKRFRKTAIWKILQEPEVQEMFDHSEKAQPLFAGWERFAWLLPREGFVAVTSIDGAMPKFIAGFAFSGRQKDAEALASEWREPLRQSHPAGRGDLTTHGSHEIETFTDKDFTIVESIGNGWYLIGDDFALLESTLDRIDGKPAASPSLATSAAFHRATAPLPDAPDAILVAQLGTLIERLASLMVAAGQQNDPKEFDELKKTESIAISTKLDGDLCRDTIFLLHPGNSAEAPLARNAMALSSAATLLYYAMALPPSLDLPEQSAGMLALIPGWDALNQTLAGKNLALSDLPKAFGPEFTSLLDWPKGAETPGGIIAVDVRDREKAAAFVDLLTGGAVGSVPWEKQQQDDVDIFTAPPGEFGAITPAVALSGKFALVGLNAAGVMQSLAQLKTTEGRLDATPDFATAAKTVTAPTSGFGYIDARAMFERLYGVLKPMLAGGLAFAPEAGQYMDAGKMPAAEVIGQHLGPIVYSQANTAQGTLIESTGPLTFNQILAGAAIGAVVAGIPALDTALSNGSLGLNPNDLLKNLGNPPPPGESPPSVQEPESR